MLRVKGLGLRRPMTAVIKLDGKPSLLLPAPVAAAVPETKGVTPYSSPFSFFSSLNTIMPCALLALRSISGTFLCTRF